MQSAVSIIRQYHDQKQSALIGVPTRRTKTICAPSACQQTRAIQPSNFHQASIRHSSCHKSYKSHPSHPQSTCRIESGLPPSLPPAPQVPPAWRTRVQERHQKTSLRPAPPASVTSALRHWRKRRSHGSANDTASPARIASSPVPRKRREEPRPPQRFFANSGYAKSAHSLRLQKPLTPAHRQAAS